MDAAASPGNRPPLLSAIFLLLSTFEARSEKKIGFNRNKKSHQRLKIESIHFDPPQMKTFFPFFDVASTFFSTSQTAALLYLQQMALLGFYLTPMPRGNNNKS